MKKMMLITAVALTGCTAVDYAALPRQSQIGDVFITQGSISEPYDSVGIVQITRRGVRAFGFADPAGTDLTAATNELAPEIRKFSADGVINARFDASPMTLGAKIVGLIFFFAPLPTEVTVTGELVRLKKNIPSAPGVAPAAPGTQL